MHSPEAQQTAQESARPPAAVRSDDLRKFRLTERARAEVFETVQGILQQQRGNPAVQKTIASITDIMPTESLRMLSQQGIIPTCNDTDDHLFILQASIAIARMRLEFQDRLASCATERDAGLFAKLAKIARIAEEAFIGITKDVLRNDAQRDAIETRETLMKHGDCLFQIVKPLLLPDNNDTDIPSDPPSHGQTNTDIHAPTLMQSILEAEETLCAKHDIVAKNNHEYLDRISLFRKLTANMRKNANVFRGSGMKVRINQLQALMLLMNFLEHEAYGGRIGYFKQPTGAGKTILFGIIARLMDVKTLILVPRTNLLSQTKRRLENPVGFPEEDVVICDDRANLPDNQIVITTYQSHVSRMNDDPRYSNMVKTCELIICDEAHRSLGRQTQEAIEQLDGEFDDEMTARDEELQQTVLEHIDQYASKAALKLGFTATPELVSKSVKKSYKVPIAETTYSELVRANVIKKFKVKQVNVSIKQHEISGTKIPAEQEVNMLHREHVYAALIQAYKDAKNEVDERLYTLASCATIDECDAFCDIAESMGVSCVVVTGREYAERSGVDHQQIAEKMLLSGRRDIIVTVDKLKEGWDFPPLNAVILARATLSPVNILQPAGRASRIYQDQKYAYIFEPSWHPIQLTHSTQNGDRTSGVPQGDGSRRNATLDYGRPLTFADALYLCGEKNVSDVCEGWHGESLRYKKIFRLEDNGQVDINDITCVGISRYAAYLEIGRNELQAAVDMADLIIMGSARSGNAIVPVYEKGAVDALQYTMDATREKLRSNGEIIMNGIVCVGLNRFAKMNGMTVDALVNHVARAKLPILGIAKTKSGPIDVFEKSAVENLPYVQGCLKRGQNVLQENGEVVIEGVTCVGISKYSKETSLASDLVMQDIRKEDIRPVAKAKSVKRTVDVYPKASIEDLPYVKSVRSREGELKENGTMTIGGIEGIGVSMYAKHELKTAMGNLQEAIDNANLQIIGRALSGHQTIDVYGKKEVDALPFVKELTENKQRGLLSMENGTVMINDMECIGVARYGIIHGLDYKTLTKKIEHARLPVIGTVVSGSKPIDVYEKSKVDELPYVKERLQRKQS